MAGRLFDRVVAAFLLVAFGPLLAAAALGVKLSSRGPALYRAQRAGLGGRVFTMYKFRTMRAAAHAAGSAITSQDDARVFALGALLRRTKLDEVPQLFNILKGEMAFVGPRPEDPRIVAQHYAPAHYATLGVLPGLASPGSIYNYTHGERLLGADDPERDYVERLLPVKLALDVVYVRRRSRGYDAAIVLRTLLTIALIAVGQREFPDPPEMRQARRLVAAWCEEF